MRGAWRPKLIHVAAVLAGALIFMLAFIYTGDSDLLFAVGTGLGGSFLFYIAARWGLCGAGER